MKRRGFLGLLAGGAVAGPSMAKQAVAASLTDLSLPGLAVSGMGSGLEVAEGVSSVGGVTDWAARLAKLSLRSPAEHEQRQRERWINGLDPDLAVNRSMALHMKMSIQRKRDYWRSIENEKSWLQRRIDGIMDW